MGTTKDGNSKPVTGKGPLGQSGVSPTGSISRNYQSEFVGPRKGSDVTIKGGAGKGPSGGGIKSERQK